MSCDVIALLKLLPMENMVLALMFNASLELGVEFNLALRKYDVSGLAHSFKKFLGTMRKNASLEEF